MVTTLMRIIEDLLVRSMKNIEKLLMDPELFRSLMKQEKHWILRQELRYNGNSSQREFINLTAVSIY